MDGLGRCALRAACTLLLLLCTAMVAAALVVAVTGGAPAATADLGRLELASADGGPAMFEAAGMVPGRSETRCTLVAAPGGSAPDAVVVRALDVTGPLAEHLLLHVEEADAGAPCTGFVGRTVFRGTLAGLAGLSAAADRGAATSWRPAPGDAGRAFRVTVSVADTPAAAGLSAGATFAWSVGPGAPVPGAGPGPAGPGPAGPGPADAAQQGTAAPTAWDRLLEDLWAVLAGLVSRPGFPLVLLLLVGIFLLVQDQLYRRDPKLALAPLHPETDLPFDGPVLGGTGDGR